MILLVINMLRYIFLLLGIMLSSIGLTFIILYLNLFVMGYSLFSFIIYIFTHLSTLLFFAGLSLILFIYLKK